MLLEEWGGGKKRKKKKKKKKKKKYKKKKKKHTKKKKKKKVLIEQVATTITIATPNPVRRFRFKNLDIECVKAYCMDYSDESLVPYLRLLDAIKDMKRIPGTTGQDIYNRVKSQYFNGYSLPELEKIVSLAKSYPPRVRKVVADILGDIRQTVLQTEMAKTILPTTRFNLDYKTA